MAGLLDAEGCLFITKQEESATPNSYNYGIGISVTNVSEDVMKWITANFGTDYKPQKLGWFRWQIFDQNKVSSFLSLVYPYLAAKKPQADLLLEYLSLKGHHCPEKREFLYRKIKEAKGQECVTTNSSNIASLKVIRPYLAGLFDGEGSIILGKRKANKNKKGSYYTRISYENSCKTSVRFFQNLFGGKIEENSHEVNLSCDKWTIDRKENKENFLLQMMPYLIVKLPKARIVLEYLRLGSGLGTTTLKREELYQLSEALKIESDLRGDVKSGPVMTQVG